MAKLVTPRAAQTLPVPSTRWVRSFSRYARWYLGRSFHAIRLSRGGAEVLTLRSPMVMYLNHPSWWDPLVMLVLAQACWPEAEHYAPMDAAMLQRYRFFRRLGFFGVEHGPRGGAAFLRSSLALLQREQAKLWVTPQGRFADARDRPVRIEPGLSHLAARMSTGWFIPVAVEYVFWTERFPEVLLRFGSPVQVDDALLPSSPRARREALHALLGEHLQATQDALAQEAKARDPAAFDTLLAGRAGVGFWYELWQRIRCRLRGQPYHRGHGEGG